MNSFGMKDDIDSAYQMMCEGVFGKIKNVFSGQTKPMNKKDVVNGLETILSMRDKEKGGQTLDKKDNAQYASIVKGITTSDAEPRSVAYSIGMLYRVGEFGLVQPRDRQRYADCSAKGNCFVPSEPDEIDMAEFEEQYDKAARMLTRYIMVMEEADVNVPNVDVMSKAVRCGMVRHPKLLNGTKYSCE